VTEAGKEWCENKADWLRARRRRERRDKNSVTESRWEG